MDFPTTTAHRVSDHTAQEINNQIAIRTQQNVLDASEQGLAAINARLIALDHEWDIERCLETGASSLTLIGVVLGSTVNKRWYALSGGVAAFLLQHALQGWCPPLPFFRRLGIRTAEEINQERYALKALRGDFANVEIEGEMADPSSILKMVQK